MTQLGYLTRKTFDEMTYSMSNGTLYPTVHYVSGNNCFCAPENLKIKNLIKFKLIKFNKKNYVTCEYVSMSKPWSSGLHDNKR